MAKMSPGGKEVVEEIKKIIELPGNEYPTELQTNTREKLLKHAEGVGFTSRSHSQKSKPKEGN
jgi:hypothetical protein